MTISTAGGRRAVAAAASLTLAGVLSPAGALAGPAPVGGGCGDPATSIGAVQGDGALSPMAGQTVTVEGAAVGDFQSGGFGGYYLQDAGDGDPATSDGVFVYAPGGVAVEEGDSVRVTGSVAEYFGMTQISSSQAAVCATAEVLPDPLEITLPSEDLERYEGMRVTLPQDLAILEYYNFGRFGEIVLGTDRQYQPTAVHEPGSPEAESLLAQNLASRITVDDGRSSQNPDPAIHPNGQEFTLDNLFRGGDLVTNATGVLDYRFERYRIQATQGADFTVANPRPERPEVGGDVEVASFNVLNYFTTLGERGADTEEEFDRQEAKIVAALAELDADVVGLIEIENNGTALEALTAALNEEVGQERYAFVETGRIGTDEITTAFIYQPATVTTVGDFATLTSEDDPLFLDDYNRPTLAQTFRDTVMGGEVTVAVNHLKSKGSPCDAVGDPTDPEGQGNCNGVRTDAAEAMADWLAGDPTDTGAANTLVIGDLNSYDKEDPIVALQDAGYTDLLLAEQGEFTYSYVFEGQLGYLDYAMANEVLTSRVTGAADWAINADEASLIDYDTTFKKDAQDALYAPDPYRSSDHDPVIVGLDLQDAADPGVVDRVSGPGRYDTSAEIAARFGDVETVYLASGEVFPDALAAAAPAIRDGVPVLLTREERVDPATTAALRSLSPERVIVLGGEERISQEVVDEVAGTTDADVERVFGPTRYETAAELTLAYDPAAVDTVYVASGEVFADALAGAPLAGRQGSPILLTSADEVPEATIASLERLDPAHIVVLGGPRRISGDAMAELAPYADTIERLYGATRYDTAAVVADRFGPSDVAFVASGKQFPDALSGAALAGDQGAPMLLTDPTILPEVTVDRLSDRDPQRVVVLGGVAAVSEAVEEAIERILTEG